MPGSVPLHCRHPLLRALGTAGPFPSTPSRHLPGQPCIEGPQTSPAHAWPMSSHPTPCLQSPGARTRIAAESPAASSQGALGVERPAPPQPQPLPTPASVPAVPPGSPRNSSKAPGPCAHTVHTGPPARGQSLKIKSLFHAVHRNQHTIPMAEMSTIL